MRAMWLARVSLEGVQLCMVRIGRSFLDILVQVPKEQPEGRREQRTHQVQSMAVREPLCPAKVLSISPSPQGTQGGIYHLRWRSLHLLTTSSCVLSAGITAKTPVKQGLNGSRCGFSVDGQVVRGKVVVYVNRSQVPTMSSYDCNSSNHHQRSQQEEGHMRRKV